jgi:hypothetical protein
VPFAKVVEEYEVYNFPIIHLVNFCREISTLDISNRVKSTSTGLQCHAFTPTRDVVRVASPARAAGRPGTTAGAPLLPPVPRLRTDAHTQTPVATRPTSIDQANRPCRRPTNGRAAVLGLRPCTSLPPHCPCRDPDCFPSPWCASQPLHRLELTYKRTRARRRAHCPDTEPPLPPPVVPTASSTLRPLAPPTRVAPACPRIPSSSPCRSLLRPSHQLAGAELPAAAAAGLRRGRPPAPFPPQVSAQIEPMRTLDHFPPIARPSPPPASPESGRPRRPLPPWITLQSPKDFQGVLRKSRAYF